MEGTPFGRYRLVELLGRGGMGEVWRAYDTAIDRVVALKVLSAHLSGDETYQERFRREAKAAAGLDEPHVVPLFDVGEIEGRLYVTMRLIEGRDLQTMIANEPLDAGRAVGIIEQVAFALDAAHQVGLVHRDVKPSNVLVAARDFAYLIDFGIARTAEEGGLTNTGAAIGTWSYMAPERFTTAGDVDPRSDIYALACVLHQTLTGQRPFPGDSMEQQVAAHMFTPPPRPSTLRHGIPPRLDEVVATGLAKDPAHRYQSARELASAARAAVASSHVVPPRPAPPPQPTQPHAHVATPSNVIRSGPMPRYAGAGQPYPPDPRLIAPQRLPAVPLVNASSSHGDDARRARRRTAILAVTAVLAVVVIAVVVIVARVTGTGTSTSRTAAPAPSASPTKGAENRTFGPQVALPFTGLNGPKAVAVDDSAGVYVADYGNNRIVRLAAGSTTQNLLDSSTAAWGLQVDAALNVYATSSGGGSVLKFKFEVGSPSTPTVLPFADLSWPYGVAVSADGNAYVSDYLKGEVVMLAAGSPNQTVLPFTGLDKPEGVAVDDAGSVYVADSGNRRVLKLAAGSTTPTPLPLAGLLSPVGVAVDVAGNVYVADSLAHRVVALSAGSDTQTVLPFTGLQGPYGLAVDKAGSVYVTDHRTNGTTVYPDSRVLKLPAT